MCLADGMSTIAKNLAHVRDRIDAACARAGRDPAEVRLLPVSKTMSTAKIMEAHAAGYHRFGENKVQEAFDKSERLADVPDLEWAVIGHLQRNKARLVARFASEFQALHTVRLAKELDKRLQAEGRQLDVLVQVNSSGEESKFGLPPEEVVDLARELSAFDALRVRGLMTLAVFSYDHERVAACFERMRDVQRRLRDTDDVTVGDGWHELSMGMSGDFELAIEHGATVVRVGQAIFGARLDANAYWPGAAT
jgi:pyridoxal phosphate enzyme (YggS family)